MRAPGALRSTAPGLVQRQPMFLPGDRGYIIEAIQRVLGERYRFEGEIGKGGFAYVLRFHDTALERDVAVKVLRPDVGGDDETVDRFLREARTSARLAHPNIVKIHDIGQTGSLNYFIMEFIEGKTLTQLIRDEGVIPLASFARIMRDVLGALACAHNQGVVHRDLKPDNIMIRSDGKTVVMDFGIAKATGQSRITVEGAFIGTAPYMSPEQGKGENVDRRSDLYSIGIVMYEMLTGQVPFQADNPSAVIFQHVFKAPPPPHTINPEIPRPLETILLKALEKEPADRYQRAEDMLSDIVRALREIKSGVPRPPVPRRAPAHPTPGESQTLVVPGRGPEGQAAQEARPAPAGGLGPPPTEAVPVQLGQTPQAGPAAMPSYEPSRRGLLIAVGVVLVILVGVGLRYTWTLSSGPPPPPKPTPTVGAVAPAQIEVRADPWADVEVDGVLVGRADPLLKVEIEPGPHTLRFSHPDLGASTRSIIAQAGGSVPLDVRFSTTATVNLTSDVPATFRVDDAVVARSVTEFSTSSLEAGRHVFEARREGYHPDRKVLELAPNETVDVTFHLVAERRPTAAPLGPRPTRPPARPPTPRPTAPPLVAKGRLQVIALPWAQVWVDGKHVADTPTAPIEVDAGQRQIELVNPPLDARWSTTVRVRPGHTETITFNFGESTLVVDVTPAARLEIDGKDFGEQEHFEITLPVGKREVVLEGSNGKRWSGTIDILPARTVRLQRTLE